MIYTEILDPPRLELLNELAEMSFIKDFYLAGGTALSLRMKLRKSYDFDFFSSKEFSPEFLLAQLKKKFDDKVEVLNLRDGTCDVYINGIQTSFFYYPYTMIKAPEPVNDFPGLKIAGIRDIAAMKASAIGNRGSEKDFFDLYCICRYASYTMTDLAADLKAKYGSLRNLSHIALALTYFDDADPDLLPEQYVQTDWNMIKAFFVSVRSEFSSAIQKNSDI